MDKNKENTLAEHSQAKVDLLGKYLTEYLAVLDKDEYTKNIRIYDLFCGEGTYSNDKKGSPLVILDKVQKIASDIRKYRFFFNDNDEENIAKLKDAIDKNTEYDKIKKFITFSIKDYQNFNPEFGDSKTKHFFFIDPFGYSDISIDKISSYFEYKAEVLLWLPLNNMYRFISSELEKENSSLKQFHEELDLKSQEDSWLEYMMDIKKGLRNKMPHLYADYFGIEKSKNIGYAMFFLTKHIRGLEKFLVAKWKVDEAEGAGWSHTQEQSLFASNTSIITSPLKAPLQEYLQQKNKPITNKQLYEFILERGFLPKHATKFLKDFQTQKILSIKDEYGKDVRKGSFYLEHKPKKIVFYNWKGKT